VERLFGGEHGGEVSFLLVLPPRGKAAGGWPVFQAFDGRRNRFWMAIVPWRAAAAGPHGRAVVYGAGGEGADPQLVELPEQGQDAIKVRMQWSEGRVNLFVNDALVRTGSLLAAGGRQEWLDSSRLTIGPLGEGGLLARFMVRRRTGEMR
jgi:hypothetical protein